MAKSKDQPPVTKTYIQSFLDKRVEKGKLTREQADSILNDWNGAASKKGKKDSNIKAKNITTLKKDELDKLLILMAYMLGIADENGVIL